MPLQVNSVRPSSPSASSANSPFVPLRRRPLQVLPTTSAEGDQPNAASKVGFGKPCRIILQDSRHNIIKRRQRTLVSVEQLPSQLVLVGSRRKFGCRQAARPDWSTPKRIVETDDSTSAAQAFRRRYCRCHCHSLTNRSTCIGAKIDLTGRIRQVSPRRRRLHAALPSRDSKPIFLEVRGLLEGSSDRLTSCATT